MSLRVIYILLNNTNCYDLNYQLIGQCQFFVQMKMPDIYYQKGKWYKDLDTEGKRTTVLKGTPLSNMEPFQIN